MIIPGILEQDVEIIDEKIDLVRHFAKTLHIDVIDGVFSPQTTIKDPQVFSKYKEEFNLEAHLMVNNPLEYLDAFANAGFRRFIGHIEMMQNIEEFIAKGQILGEVGLALDLNTDLGKITVPLDDLDVILLMGVKAGASGQAFNKSVLGKIKTLREKSFIPIEIDGGITDETIVLAKEAGANRFVTTSFLFSQNPIEAFEKLNQAVNS